MREVAAIWDEISHDPKPKINIEKLADFVQNGPYKHPSDQRYYEAYQVILYNIYVSSGFRDHLINKIKNQKEKASGKELTESQLASLSKTIDN